MNFVPDFVFEDEDEEPRGSIFDEEEEISENDLHFGHFSPRVSLENETELQPTAGTLQVSDETTSVQVPNSTSSIAASVPVSGQVAQSQSSAPEKELNESVIDFELIERLKIQQELAKSSDNNPKPLRYSEELLDLRRKLDQKAISKINYQTITHYSTYQKTKSIADYNIFKKQYQSIQILILKLSSLFLPVCFDFLFKPLPDFAKSGGNFPKKKISVNYMETFKDFVGSIVEKWSHTKKSFMKNLKEIKKDNRDYYTQFDSHAHLEEHNTKSVWLDYVGSTDPLLQSIYDFEEQQSSQCIN